MSIIGTIEGLESLQRDIYLALEIPEENITVTERQLLLFCVAWSYKNNNWRVPLVELERLGGFDPASVARTLNRKRENAWVVADDDMARTSQAWGALQQRCYIPVGEA